MDDAEQRTYPEPERLIFKHAVAGVARCFDPAACDRALRRACRPEGLDAILKDFGADTKDVAPEHLPHFQDTVDAATDRLVAAGRVAFGLAPFADDGSGVTEGEVIDVLDHFFLYVMREKKGPGPSPSSSPDTAPSPDPAASPTPSSAG